MKHKFSYCLLQYVDNGWLKERMNIGILLVDASGEFVELRTRGWQGRVLTAFPNLEKSNFTEDLNQLKRTFSNWQKNDDRVQRSLFVQSAEPERTKDGGLRADKLASFLAPDGDSSYRWVFGGAGVCDSLSGQMDKLFARFVMVHDRVAEEKTRRTDDNVWTTVKEVLSVRDLAKHLQPEPVVSTALSSVKFQAGYRNGALHVIQPLSFDSADEDHLLKKARVWVGTLQDIKAKKTEPVRPHLIVGKPGKPELFELYDRSISLLKEIGGEESVFEEENSGQFADLVADQLRHH